MMREDASSEEKRHLSTETVQRQAMIVQMLIKQVKSLVLQCNKPKAVKSVQNTMLWTEMNQRRLREGGSVKEYLHAMKEIYDHLTG